MRLATSVAAALLLFWAMTRVCRRWSDRYDVFGAIESETKEPSMLPFVDGGDCRDRFQAAPRPGRFLIVMSGGSTVEMGERDSLPRVLERRFHEAGFPDVSVMNCGVVAQNSSQELARLVFRLSDLKPKVLVVYDGANDILNPIYTDPRPGYPHNFLLRERNPLLAGDRTPLWAVLALRTPLLRRALGRWLPGAVLPLAAVRACVGYGTQRWREELAETYARNVVKTAAICRGVGIRPVVFLQPVLYDKKPLGEREERLERFGMGYERRFSGIADWREHETDVKARIRELKRRDAFGAWPEFADLSGALDGAPDVFLDHVHVRPAGNRIIAEAIFKRLRALGVPPGPPRRS